jgi:cytochrome c biogenesis protein CcmG/thiol:disulfide interchange protein DsbE
MIARFLSMKINSQTLLWLSLVSLCLITRVTAQISGTQNLPSVNVKDLHGKTVNTSEFSNGDKPYVLDFWATWCKPCILELNTIDESYEDWKAETGIKVIAISIDDARNSVKVLPFVNGRQWEYEVYLDENSDLKRALNVNNVPHTFIISPKGEILWQHNSYTPGDEITLYEAYKNILAGKNPNAH